MKMSRKKFSALMVLTLLTTAAQAHQKAPSDPYSETLPPPGPTGALKRQKNFGGPNRTPNRQYTGKTNPQDNLSQKNPSQEKTTTKQIRSKL